MTGIDPVRLRRRNLIPPKSFPFKTAVGTTYDSGDFAPILDKALALAHYAEFKKRRRDRSGASCAASASRAFSSMRARCRPRAPRCCSKATGWCSASACRTPDKATPRSIRVWSPQSSASGRAHRTPPWRHQPGPEGQPLGRLALHHDGRQRALSRGRPDAGEGKADRRRDAGSRRARRDLRAGKFPRGRHRPARFAVRRCGARQEAGDTLDTKATVDTPQTFPNGCHIAEVEIDPDTGTTEIVAYAAVDDAGVVLDHTLAAGQLVGGRRRGSARRCWRTRCTMRATRNSSPGRSWTTPCRAQPTCRRSARRTTTRARPPIRSA